METMRGGRGLGGRAQGRPQADATDAAALGPAPLGAPRHVVWVHYSFYQILPDTPCA